MTVDAGLCARCRNARRIESAKGSRFFLCRVSERVAGWPRYPRLPVRECRHFDEGEPS